MKRIGRKIAWYKNRIAAMSVAEIIYRIEEAAKRKTGRFFAGHLRRSALDYGALPDFPGLRAGVEVLTVDAFLMRQWEEDARRAQMGEYFLLNQQWPPCPDQHAPLAVQDLARHNAQQQEKTARQILSCENNRWHLDPFSGDLWPRNTYCFDIDYRHAHGKGDVKFVWELNRLQYLQPLAALACKRKDAALAAFCLDAIESWIDNNPPFKGVNWGSGIELTMRVISILTVTTLVGEHLSRPARAKIWATIEAHGYWLARYPSRYSSANNHRLSEGLGLFVIGALCPHFAAASAWKKNGWDILYEGARLQILPDGAGAEQAVTYTAFVLEMLLTGLHIAQSTGVAVPDAYRRKVTLGGEYLRWLIDKKSNHPRIGDDDNACVFGAYHFGDDHLCSIASAIAALTGRADIAPPLVQFHLRQAVFGAPPASDFTPQGMRCFAHTGLTIGRHTSRNGEVLLAFDHGYLGYLSIAAHGHADALAVWLHIDGQPVFVDAGTYLYHGDADKRQHFRSTSAHNTLTLEGTDSSIMAGNFNWSHKAECIVRKTESRSDFWQVEAEHDGYQKQFGVTHRRIVSVSPASGAVIEDVLIADAPHRVDIGFLLHPDLTARREGDEIIILKGEHLILRMRHEGGLHPFVAGPDSADCGWYSPAFAMKQATTRIGFSGMLAQGQKALTHLFWVC